MSVHYSPQAFSPGRRVLPGSAFPWGLNEVCYEHVFIVQAGLSTVLLYTLHTRTITEHRPACTRVQRGRTLIPLSGSAVAEIGWVWSRNVIISDKAKLVYLPPVFTCVLLGNILELCSMCLVPVYGVIYSYTRMHFFNMKSVITYRCQGVSVLYINDACIHLGMSIYRTVCAMSGCIMDGILI